jgi:hypothetical protein
MVGVEGSPVVTSESRSNGPATVRTFTVSKPVRACRLRRHDLRHLYRIIQERQNEHRQTVLSQLSQLPRESAEQFEIRRARVADAFVTTVNITLASKEVITESSEHFVVSENLPDNIVTVFFTTIAGPSAIGLVEQQQSNRATLLLDFSRPTVFDFSKFPTFATENASQLYIWSSSEQWFTTLEKRISDLFNDRRTRFDWLHRPGIYDVLLLVVGLPFSFAIDYLTSPFITKLNLSNVLTSALYIYFFIAGLYIFRGLFTYSRWVFPKTEIESQYSPPMRHRGLWAAIALGIPGAVFGGAIIEAIKALW